MVQLLLTHDQGAVSTPTSMGILPLHLACVCRHFEIVILVFDANPQAIHTSDDSGEAPLDKARRLWRGREDLVPFLNIKSIWSIKLVMIEHLTRMGCFPFTGH